MRAGRSARRLAGPGLRVCVGRGVRGARCAHVTALSWCPASVPVGAPCRAHRFRSTDAPAASLSPARPTKSRKSRPASSRARASSNSIPAPRYRANTAPVRRQLDRCVQRAVSRKCRAGSEPVPRTLAGDALGDDLRDRRLPPPCRVLTFPEYRAGPRPRPRSTAASPCFTRSARTAAPPRPAAGAARWSAGLSSFRRCARSSSAAYVNAAATSFSFVEEWYSISALLHTEGRGHRRSHRRTHRSSFLLDGCPQQVSPAAPPRSTALATGSPSSQPIAYEHSRSEAVRYRHRPKAPNGSSAAGGRGTPACPDRRRGRPVMEGLTPPPGGTVTGLRSSSTGLRAAAAAFGADPGGERLARIRRSPTSRTVSSRTPRNPGLHRPSGSTLDLAKVSSSTRTPGRCAPPGEPCRSTPRPSPTWPSRPPPDCG